MIRRNIAAGVGLSMLLGIGAASTALDIKSRHDVAQVNHTLKVLQDTSELRVELRQAEAAGRGYALTGAPTFIDDFRTASARIPAAFAALQAEVTDSPAQVERLRSIDELIRRRIAISGELIRLHTMSDQAGIDALNARAEGRAAMAVISQRLAEFTGEEKRQLAARSATSRTTGTQLLVADLAGVMLILLIAAYLIRSTYVSHRALRFSLSRSKAETSSLEARA